MWYQHNEYGKVLTVQMRVHIVPALYLINTIQVSVAGVGGVAVRKEQNMNNKEMR